jgi:hypothetical protein
MKLLSAVPDNRAIPLVIPSQALMRSHTGTTYHAASKVPYPRSAREECSPPARLAGAE